jgi:hypothetical protein
MNNDALSAAIEMLPLIKSLRDETESARRPAQPIVEQIVERRLGRIGITKTLDGLGLRPVAALEVLETLAGAEPSVAWIVWNNMLPCFFGRYLEPRVRAEIFGNARSLYASVGRSFPGVSSPSGSCCSAWFTTATSRGVRQPASPRCA